MTCGEAVTKPEMVLTTSGGAKVAVGTVANVLATRGEPTAPPPNNCGQQCTSHGDCTGSCNYCGEGKCEEGAPTKHVKPTASHFKPLGPTKARLF
jgi:hypothetical protein